MDTTESLLLEDMRAVSHMLFNKNLFGIFHGSISAKISQNRFFINARNALFDRIGPESIVMLYIKKDYRWHDASIDTSVHISIYQNLSDAKCIAYCFPDFTMAYALIHDVIIPEDYFGTRLAKEIPVYHPKDFDSWQERAEVEIYRFFKEQKTRIMVIRGYGVFLYARDLFQLSRMVSVLENSCKLLHLSKKGLTPP